MPHKMRRDDGIRLLYQACKVLSDVSGYNVSVVSNEAFGAGHTVYDDDDDSISVIEIGSMGLEGIRDVDVEVSEVMLCVVAAFHEVCGHALQHDRIFDMDTDLASILALNHYACISSKYYYGLRGACNKSAFGNHPIQQYYEQPIEIAAQYMGLRSAYSWLSGQFGNDDALTMVKDYLEYRISHHSECLSEVDEDWTMEDILDAFDVKFRESIHKHRDYGNGKNKNDDLSKSPMASYGRMVAVMPDGLKQDWMLASVSVGRMENRNDVLLRKAFSRLDMNPANAFGLFSKPRVKSRGVSLRQLDPELDLLLDDAKPENQYEAGDEP